MKYVHLITLIAILFISGCKNNTETNTTKDSVTDTTTTTDMEANTSISNANGVNIGGFNLDPLEIYANGKKYLHKSKPNKHKFYTNGTMVYEVKFKESSFKLRDKNSNLLWKVKIYPDKIKISDNEENENAYIIKNYPEKIKIKRNDIELTQVKLDQSTLYANDKIIYKISNNPDSYAFAILAIDAIPVDQRIFILAELLKQL